MTIKPIRYGMYTAMGLTALVVSGFASGLLKPKELKAVYEDIQPKISEKIASLKEQVVTPIVKQQIPINTKLPKLKPKAGLKSPKQQTMVKRPFEKMQQQAKPPEGKKLLKVQKPDPRKGNTGNSNLIPTFDILRVEKDGSILVAGRSAPDHGVELALVSGKVLGRTQTKNNGDFVITPDAPLAPGDYVLKLRATNSKGSVFVSQQSSIVHIPKRDGEVLAMITSSGEAVRITAKPKALKRIELEPILKQTKQKTAVKDIAPHILIEAVEIEGNTVFVAGNVAHSQVVRIYIDNAYLGTAKGNAKNKFELSKEVSLKAGKHMVRADVIDIQSGSVLTRAEVPLHRDKSEIVTAKIDAPEKVMKQLNPNSTEVKTILSGRTVIIKPGDNLWRISKRTYGRGIRYTTIYNANRDQIRNPSRIYVGQVFKLPDLTVIN